MPSNSQKHQLLGHPAAVVHPAWKVSVSHSKTRQTADGIGSKVIISRLPADVGENELEDLFRKTVGPLKDLFIIYNSQGLSKGMAVVSFQRPGDAGVARAKYNGKIIDGRRPIKIEIIVDQDTPTSSISTRPTLLTRLSVTQTLIDRSSPNSISTSMSPPTQPRAHGTDSYTKPPRAPRAITVNPNTPQTRPRRVRQKKGPRRLKKSIAQLDQEMDEYFAAVDVKSNGFDFA